MAQKTSKTRQFFKRVGLHFFDKWKLKSIFFVALVGVGLVAYTTFLPREGFPSIQFPLTLVNGTYFVDDAEQVDREVVQPALEALEGVDGITDTQTTASANTFTLVAFFSEDTNPQTGTSEVQEALQNSQVAQNVEFNFVSIDPASYLNEYDLLVAVSSEPSLNDDIHSTKELQDQAKEVATIFAQDERIELAETVPLIRSAPDPATGQPQQRQTAFSFFAEKPDSADRLYFSPVVVVGVDKAEGVDVIELSEAVTELNEEINERSPQFATGVDSPGTNVAIGADFASSIKTQIGSLQSNLLSGIVAVALVSWLLITWRVSLITSIFMVSVVLTTMLTLLLVGYTLNTITLFALVLALGLFVDDSTIISEAVVAARRQGKDLRSAIGEALRKVAPASIAGTLTTVLVFLPLVFVGGILGEFIRLLPITVIISLIASLLLSLTLIPLLSRFAFRGMDRAQGRKTNLLDVVAAKVAAMPRLLKSRPGLGRMVGVSMVSLSIAFLAGTAYFAQKVEFNIFPQSNDSDQIQISFNYAPGTTIEAAQELADQANDIIARELGDNAERALYGGFEQANERSAGVVIELVPFTEREPTSFELMDRLEKPLQQLAGQTAEVRLSQIDAGPPQQDLPFAVQVQGEDRAEALALAQDIQDFLEGRSVTRVTGTTATVTQTALAGTEGVVRQNGQRFIEVAAGFDADDTSALVEAAQAAVEEEFPPARVDEYGELDLGFDFGQESENAESFAALGIVFPIAIGAILLLLAFQFKSLMQPLLIIMAVPFSLFGVFFGLYVTDNALSFFSTVGIIGLIGIAVNNTILLTDYANQERRDGSGRVDAISNALEQRFRPLLATTLTTIVALLPLALNDPFWEPLAYTIIFGLASSTVLVILAFPYYYLAAETMRGYTMKIFLKLVRR